MEATYLHSTDIVKFLREVICELYFDDFSISWKEAKTIPIDFSKFYSYPAKGEYEVELLLKVYRKGSNYEAIFCYFVDLNNEENIFSIPAFCKWNKELMNNPSLSYNEKRYYSPLVDEEISIEHFHLGTHLLINLENSTNPKYLTWTECKTFNN